MLVALSPTFVVLEVAMTEVGGGYRLQSHLSRLSRIHVPLLLHTWYRKSFNGKDQSQRDGNQIPSRLEVQLLWPHWKLH